MSKGKLSVRIPTVKLIKALSDKLKSMEKEFKESELLKAKYEQAKKEWAKKILDTCLSTTVPRNVNINKSWNGSAVIQFSFDRDAINLPEEPKCPQEKIVHEYNYNIEKAEIENVLRVLKMTDDETVNTSTYQAVSKYL